MTLGSWESDTGSFQCSFFCSHGDICCPDSLFYFGNFALQEYPESEGLRRAHVMCRNTNMELDSQALHMKDQSRAELCSGHRKDPIRLQTAWLLPCGQAKCTTVNVGQASMRLRWPGGGVMQYFYTVHGSSFSILQYVWMTSRVCYRVSSVKVTAFFPPKMLNDKVQKTVFTSIYKSQFDKLLKKTSLWTGCQASLSLDTNLKWFITAGYLYYYIMNQSFVSVPCLSLHFHRRACRRNSIWARESPPHTRSGHRAANEAKAGCRFKRVWSWFFSSGVVRTLNIS